MEKVDFFRFLELPTSDAIILALEQSKYVMFGFFSACQIFELGPQKKLRQPKSIVPNGTKLAGAVQKELMG